MKKISEERYEEATENHEGFCTSCNSFTCEDVEPDAQDYECPECGENSVVGAENALVYEHIEISDDEDDDSDVGIISLSDDED